jgi:hypothetical protein
MHSCVVAWLLSMTLSLPRLGWLADVRVDRVVADKDFVAIFWSDGDAAKDRHRSVTLWKLERGRVAREWHERLGR